VVHIPFHTWAHEKNWLQDRACKLRAYEKLSRF
jgi:hypothetical protein